MTNDETHRILNDENPFDHSFRHSELVIPSEFGIRHSLDQPDRQRIAVELAFARLDRSNDHEDKV